MTSPVSIAELDDGVPARVEGVVQLAHDALRSPLMGRDCVYWDVRRGLRQDPERQGATTFWVEDASGRILVRGENLSVDVRARRTKDVVEAVAADTNAVSERLAELKRRLRHTAGDEAKKLNAERKRLAKIVTFLYAVRAQARDKIHLGGMSLHEQGRWIEENAPEERQDGGAASIAIAVDRYEIVIAAGDHVIAEGVPATRPVPDGLQAAGGYREIPMCRVLGCGSDGVVHITGVGASAPAPVDDSTQDAPTEAPPPNTGAGFERAVLVFMGALGAVATTLWWFLG